MPLGPKYGSISFCLGVGLVWMYIATHYYVRTSSKVHHSDKKSTSKRLHTNYNLGVKKIKTVFIFFAMNFWKIVFINVVIVIVKYIFFS